MNITGKEVEKFEYLVGFVNEIAEIVSDPEQYLDPNAKDLSVFAIGYEEDNGNVELSTIESNELEDFISNMSDIVDMVRKAVRVDFTKQWHKLQGVDDE